MELCVLPAKLTWLLQMLDTHCVVRLKQLLHEGLLTARLEGQGKVSAARWWSSMLNAVERALLHRDWMPVFKANGVAGSSADLRPKSFGLEWAR